MNGAALTWPDGPLVTGHLHRGCSCPLDPLDFDCLGEAVRVLDSDMRLLVVEDEGRIAELVKAGLARAGFAVAVVGLCGDARAALAVTSYDAAVVDPGLPDGDGLHLVRELRKEGNQTPVLVLTARERSRIASAVSIPAPMTISSNRSP